MRSSWGAPTNAQALAVLDAIHSFDNVADAARAGFATPALAAAYFHPTGILPRMRLIACGVANRGDKFKSPADDAWWKAKYRYAGDIAWNVLLKYATLWNDAADPPITVDEDVASGDNGAISQTMNRVLLSDFPPFRDSPCEPPFIIPTIPNMFPPMNPACADFVRKVINTPVEAVKGIKKEFTTAAWIAIAVVAYFILKDK